MNATINESRKAINCPLSMKFNPETFELSIAGGRAPEVVVGTLRGNGSEGSDANYRALGNLIVNHFNTHALLQQALRATLEELEQLGQAKNWHDMIRSQLLEAEPSGVENERREVVVR